MNKLEKLQQSLPDAIDCGIIVSNINRRYFTGMKSSAGILLVMRRNCYFIIDFRYYEKAKEICKNCEVLLLTDEVKQLSELFKKHDVKTIGLETSLLSINQYQQYKKNYPSVVFSEEHQFQHEINNMRLYKTEKELAWIKQAQEITDAAYTHILSKIQAGVTEREIALELDYYMLKQGAEAISFDTIVVAGKNSSLPHGVPSDYSIQNGDFITMDFGAVIQGYHSDMTRTVVMKSASEEMKRVYDTVLQAQKLALDAVKPGVSCSSVDKIARDYIDGKGYKGTFGHSLGHGVGMDIHEIPVFSSREQTITEPGMVITVEPGIYLNNKFGVRIEDMIFITETGCENFTASHKELTIL